MKDTNQPWTFVEVDTSVPIHAQLQLAESVEWTKLDGRMTYVARVRFEGAPSIHGVCTDPHGALDRARCRARDAESEPQAPETHDPWKWAPVNKGPLVAQLHPCETLHPFDEHVEVRIQLPNMSPVTGKAWTSATALRRAREAMRGILEARDAMRDMVECGPTSAPPTASEGPTTVTLDDVRGEAIDAVSRGRCESVVLYVENINAQRQRDHEAQLAEAKACLRCRGIGRVAALFVGATVPCSECAR